MIKISILMFKKLDFFLSRVLVRLYQNRNRALPWSDFSPRNRSIRPSFRTGKISRRKYIIRSAQWWKVRLYSPIFHNEEEPRHQIMMINPDDFPPREDFIKDDIAHTPKILSKAVSSSSPDQLSQAEKVLNWQTENSLAQNQLLSTINRKIDQLTSGRIQQEITQPSKFDKRDTWST